MLSTDDAERWQQILPAHVSVFGSVEYVKLCTQQSGYAARLLVVETPDSVVAYPFFLRPVDTLPFAAGFAGYCDTFTPPYLGPIGQGDSTRSADFASLFAAHCRDQRIVAEFAHLDPWTELAHVLDPACVTANREIVYVDLTWDADRIWRDSMKPDCRRQTKQAQAAGVRIRRASSSEDVAQFHRLHTETMKRRQAHDHYYFAPDHFQTIFETMSENAFFVLAEYEGRLVAGGLFFHDAETIYWDLSAADMDFAKVRPVNGYLHDTICRALGQGWKRMVLGGGYQAGDGVFRFKTSFSPLRAKFCVYKKVHDADAYAALTRAWSQHHAGAEPGDFFPAYRSHPPTNSESSQP